MWAPWRSQYLTQEQPKDCIFCTKPKEERDPENYILFRNTKSFAILNIFPYNNGHTMVVPFRHAASLDSLSPEELEDIMVASRWVTQALTATYHPDGFNLGMNIGASAGAGIAGHIHMHIVPRWNGDTNFMPIVGETKVVNEALDETYRKLVQSLI
ncbi:MAG: HIT domain-containing protein [Armatimonadetes bacterium]|nr:HIT domain-containing protein [Armatimonadota bacterium]